MPSEQFCSDIFSLQCHASWEENNMLWTIMVVLLVLWLLGFSLHVGGALIHLLLVVAVVVLVINLLGGRRATL
jgi:hypothetical protein